MRQRDGLAERIRQLLGQGQRAVLATVVEAHGCPVVVGSSWLVTEGESWRFLPWGEPAGGGLPGAGLDEPLSGLEQAVLREGRRRLHQAAARPAGGVVPARERLGHLWWPVPAHQGSPAGRVRLFVELLLPPPRLVLVGAGQDAPPLVRIAAEAGWEVYVADPRPAFARPERFPQAREVRRAEPAQLPEEWFAGDVYAVVMNHHFLRDQAALARLLQLPVAYIGLLGPRARTERLLARVAADRGRPLSSQELERIYSPVGLDIGGEGPGAIALAVVAEMMALRHGRPAPHLRDRRGPLHPDRVAAAPGEHLPAPGAAAGAGRG